MPYFLLTIAPNSRATIRNLKDWEACEGDGQKVCANNFNFFFFGGSKLVCDFRNAILMNYWNNLSKWV